jgi:predicted tellurium resistance membrane protein TerC
MQWLNWMADPNAWISLLTLTALEIVLGIDNVIFISILAGKLPAGQQVKARTIGLTLALVTRILLLLTINWLMHLTKPLFELLGRGFSGVISDFVNRRPTIRMLALAFLILIGAVLAADGLGQHIDRGYVYFAMAFAVAVELLNLRERKGGIEAFGARRSAFGEYIVARLGDGWAT